MAMRPLSALAGGSAPSPISQVPAVATEPPAMAAVSSFSSRPEEGRLAANRARVDTASILGAAKKVRASVCLALSLGLVGGLAGGVGRQQGASEDSAVGLASVPPKRTRALAKAVRAVLAAQAA